jgi:hypothetical protein
MLILSMKGDGTDVPGALFSAGFSWWVWFLLEAATFFLIIIMAKEFPASERQGSNNGKFYLPAGSVNRLI